MSLATSSAAPPLSVSVLSEFPWGGDANTMDVLVSIQGASSSTNQIEIETKQRHVIFCVDTSGSMGMEADRESSTSLGMVQKALKASIEVMKPGDRLTIVAFATNASVIIEGASPSDERVPLAIRKLKAEGKTALFDGLQTSLRCCREHQQNNGEKDTVIILMTDGFASHGPKTSEDICEQLRADISRHPQCRPPTVFCIGFGGSHNGHLLKDISSVFNNGGMYVLVESGPKATEVMHNVFANIVDLFVNTVARDIRLSISAAEENKKLTISTTFPTFDNVVNIPTISRNETLDVVVSIQTNRPQLTVHLQALDSNNRQFCVSKTFVFASEQDKHDQNAVDYHRNRILVAKALDNAANNKWSLQDLEALQHRLRTCSSADLDSTKTLKTDIDMCLAACKEQEEMQSAFVENQMSNRLLSCSNSHSAQRSLVSSKSAIVTTSSSSSSACGSVLVTSVPAGGRLHRRVLVFDDTDDDIDVTNAVD